MGCTGSKQARLDREISPSRLPRSSSMPVHHVVTLNSSTLGSLRLDHPITTRILGPNSDFKNRDLYHDPTLEPPETINTWELMAGLEDSSPENRVFGKRSMSESTVEELSPQHQLHLRSPELSRNRSPEPDKCPPGGEKKVVFYFTSLRGVRKTYEDCCLVSVILRNYHVRIDERDVSLHGGFKEELNELLGEGYIGSRLPRVFANGRHMGGVDEVRQMHEAGELRKAFELCEVMSQTDGTRPCERCGDLRFVLCERCSGGRKVFVEEEEEEVAGGGGFQDCLDCNENGMVRCPVCCS